MASKRSINKSTQGTIVQYESMHMINKRRCMQKLKSTLYLICRLFPSLKSSTLRKTVDCLTCKVRLLWMPGRVKLTRGWRISSG